MGTGRRAEIEDVGGRGREGGRAWGFWRGMLRGQAVVVESSSLCHNYGDGRRSLPHHRLYLDASDRYLRPKIFLDL